jgi:hypothetical protein
MDTDTLADLRALVEKAENNRYQVVDIHIDRLTALLDAAGELAQLREALAVCHVNEHDLLTVADQLKNIDRWAAAARITAQRHLAALSEKEDQ